MSDKLYSALKTFVVSFVALFVPSLLGFLHNAQEWASMTGDEANFPSLEPLGKAVVSAIIAGVVAVVNYLTNLGQERGVLPGRAAKYDPPKNQ